MGLISISKTKFKRAMRNARCVAISASDTGSLRYQCGKQILVHDTSSQLYYKLTGRDAMRVGYQLKRRNAGYTPKRKHSYKGHR